MSRVCWFCLPAAILFVLLPGAAAAKTAAAPSCAATITTSITLAADLNCSASGADGLVVGANGIVINLNGHTITGAGGDYGGTGIFNNGHNNITVKNGTIRNFYYGYHSQNAHETVTKVTVALDGTQNFYGLYLEGGSGSTYSYNTVTNAYYGVWVVSSASDKFAHNTLTGNAYGAVEYFSQKDTWTTNNFSHSDGSGFVAYDSSPILTGLTRLTGNKSNHNGIAGFDLNCAGASTAVVKNTTANYNGGDGIYSHHCSSGADFSRFTGNRTNHNGGGGIYSLDDVNARFSGNTANANTGYGFYFDNPDGYVITKNVSNGNANDGLYLNTGNAYFPSLLATNTSSSNGGYGYNADYLVSGTGNIGNLNALGRRHNVSG